ncbi:hypothetical protein ACFVIM_23635 [Streptomyces sp. NPDC057638]|uniref:hypothetical protein n=1 Tax=Streptomyces sp. NPDC057638 TaxID=3346190 RepID=UPI003681C3E2
MSLSLSPPSATDESAVLVLRQALTARQLAPAEVTAPGGEAYAFVCSTGTPYVLAGVRVDPQAEFTERGAAFLQAALAGERVTARVTVCERLPDTARIALPTPADARALAGLVWREMPEAHQAADELRATVLRLGLVNGCPMDDVRPRAAGGRVTIGDLTAQQALLVLRLLGTRPHAPFRPSSWQYLHDLAALLRDRLRETVPPAITTAADPVCGTCRDSRDPGITLGDAAPDQIRALAAHLADGPRRVTPRRPPRPGPRPACPGVHSEPAQDPLITAVRAVLAAAGWTRADKRTTGGEVLEFTGSGRLALTHLPGGAHQLTVSGTGDGEQGVHRVTVPCGDNVLPLLRLVVGHQRSLPGTLDGFLEAVAGRYSSLTVESGTGGRL